MRLKMTINEIPPSNNKYQGQGSKRTQIVDYQREKERWAFYCMALKQKVRDQFQGPPLKEATVILKYHFKDNIRRDPDNYSGKMVLDGLQSAGFIADDSFKNIDLLPLADFGNGRESMDIYILSGKRLELLVHDLVEEGSI